MKAASLSIVLFTAVVAGCASSGSEPSASASDQAVSATSASTALNAQLFDDQDPSEGVDYVLLGTIPGRTEACEVVVGRRGLEPPKYSWSSVTIHPFGASADTVEAHGPVEIPWATQPDQSSDDDAIQTNGNVTVYTRTSAPDEQKPTKMTLTLTYAAGAAHRYDHITSAAIAGNDVASEKNASCSDLAPAIVLRFSAYEGTANAAMKAWEKDNDEDLEELGVELEDCSLSSPTTVGCAFGNDTNEEQLFIDFELKDGGLGKVLDAQRSSDFDNE